MRVSRFSPLRQHVLGARVRPVPLPHPEPALRGLLHPGRPCPEDRGGHRQPDPRPLQDQLTLHGTALEPKPG